MQDQPKAKPLRGSAFFNDHRSARPVVSGTIARGQLRLEDSLFHTGKVDGRFAEEFPFPVTKEVLLRGQERFNIFCSPCHGRLGNGNGMIVQRGFLRPPSFHEPRIRQSPPGYFFDVITNGFGTMYDYADRVAPADRWAIAAYIKTLQLSQDAPLDVLPPEEKQKIDSAPAESAAVSLPLPTGSDQNHMNRSGGTRAQ
jgi:hypothetical protein